MVIHPIDDTTLIVAPNVYGYYKEQLSGSGLNLIKGESFLSKKYPKNIAYNVGRFKNFAFHNFKYTDKRLLEELKKRSIELININQGYSKCSTGITGDFLITSDQGIYKDLIEKDIDLLLIEPGHIRLEGYNYGFCGGASGVLKRGELIFHGDLTRHPNYLKITNYLKEREYKLFYSRDYPLEDIGSIIGLNT